MQVGLLKLVFHIPGARSLKDKRRVVAKIRDRVRARFQVSISEVEDHDLHGRAVLGVALVGNDQRNIQATLDTLTRFIEDLYVAPLVHRDQEIVPFPLLT
jgi:uncharacterized protein YlxP (DUF503 family)